MSFATRLPSVVSKIKFEMKRANLSNSIRIQLYFKSMKFKTAVDFVTVLSISRSAEMFMEFMKL